MALSLERPEGGWIEMTSDGVGVMADRSLPNYAHTLEERLDVLCTLQARQIVLQLAMMDMFHMAFAKPDDDDGE